MPIPVFAHLSMIWGPDGKRLSKRHGATSVEAYAELGYLPEAIMNYLALLGWSLDGETTIIDAETLKSSFSLDRISKNPAIFDVEKLDWMNGVYLRELPAEEFVARMVPWLEDAGLSDAADVASRPDWFARLAPLVSERIKRLDEVVEKVAFLFAEPTIEESAREKVLCQGWGRPSAERVNRGAWIVRLDLRVHRGSAARTARAARAQTEDGVPGDPGRSHWLHRLPSALRVAGVARPRDDARSSIGRSRARRGVGDSDCQTPLDWGLTPPMGVRNIPFRAAPWAFGNWGMV